MSEKRDDGGSAFPRAGNFEPRHGEGLWTSEQDGMTLRDWFAGQALCGLIASLPVDAEIKRPHMADAAFGMADAMLEARK